MRLTEVKIVKCKKSHNKNGFSNICYINSIFLKPILAKDVRMSKTTNINFVIHISDLSYMMAEKFLDKRYIHYNACFSRSESIICCLKGDDGVLKLIGTTENAVDKDIQLKNTIYNITRLNNLKDTVYWAKNAISNSIIYH